MKMQQKGKMGGGVGEVISEECQQPVNAVTTAIAYSSTMRYNLKYLRHRALLYHKLIFKRQF